MKSKKVLAASFLVTLILLSPITTTAQKQPSVRVRMGRLLGLSPQKTPPKVEILRTSEEADLVLEDLRFQADHDNWVPAIVVKPRRAIDETDHDDQDRQIPIDAIGEEGDHAVASSFSSLAGSRAPKAGPASAS